MEEGDERKRHRKRQAGPKAEKKKSKNKHEQELTARQRNPKAFAFHSVNKIAKAVRRTLDIKEKKHHVPVVDRTPVEPPPVLIAVVGPPKVGKTTLINCLIRNFTRQKLATIQGPVTIVSAKKRRLTLMECNNDINSMIDMAKVADLVLLLVDASFGFEMEVFEFLNICQVHGFPKIMGVLTHLDMFRQNKQLRKTKKRLKHRFWTEVYQGAKLFYLSGMVNGEYQKTEIHNLGRFISVMKFRPLQWRTTHPYILADRMEDVTDPEVLRQNPKADRDVCLYGYVRGTHFMNKSCIHIPGCGDHTIHDMSVLSDPCPLPDQEKKRSLNQQERLIYAPLSGVGGIVYDKDAVYIDLGGSHSHRVDEEGQSKPSNALVSSLIDAQHTLDSKMAASGLQVFSQAEPISSQDVESDDSKQLPQEKIVTDSDGRVRRKAIFGDEESDEENEVESDEEELEEDEDKISEETHEDLELGKKSNRGVKKRKVEVESYAFADSDDDLQETDIKLFATSAKPSKSTIKTTLGDETCRSQWETKHDSESDNESDTESKGDLSDSGSHTSDSTGLEEPTLEKGKHFLSDCKSRTITKTKSDESGPYMGNSADNVIPKPVIPKPLSHIDENLQKIRQQVTAALGRTESVKTSTKECATDRDDEEDWGVESGDDDQQESESEGQGSDGSNSENEGVEGSESEDSEEEMDEDSGEETGHLKWKENLATKAAEAFIRRQQETPNLRKLVYGKVIEGSDSEEEGEGLGGLFKITGKKGDKLNRANADGQDCTCFPVEQVREWELEEMKELIKDCFVTGKWDSSRDAQTLLDQDDELFGDFEDLETGEQHHGKEATESDMSDDNDDLESDASQKADDVEEDDKKEKLSRREKYIEKKKRVKDMFDQAYDETGKGTYFDEWKSEMEQQANMNRREFENMDDDLRVQYEGFRPGLYVRVQVNNMPSEFIDNFDPTDPTILGGLLSAEQNIGYVQTRIKKHRWHKKILKTRDPIIMSLGWRRFQTIALYSIQDHNSRHRLLKYTPEHLHCHASFWGPITPQGTGMLAVQSLANSSADFRISATGVILEMDKSMTVVKKLKLTGEPYKIYKKTAFIKGMFNSALEVAKFEGSSIRAVSGIRGQIKKAINESPGAFRATFEDKILLSDIVFVRTWYPVQIPKFYNPVTTLLMPSGERNQWQGMKTMGQLRRERSLFRNVNQDHLYKPVQRNARAFKPLVIPADLQRSLPFKDKPKAAKKIKDPVQNERIAVVLEPKEKKVKKMIKMLKTLHQHKMRQQRLIMRERAAKHQKELAKINARKDQKTKEVKKQLFRTLGKMEKRKQRSNKHHDTK